MTVSTSRLRDLSTILLAGCLGFAFSACDDGSSSSNGDESTRQNQQGMSPSGESESSDESASNEGSPSNQQGNASSEEPEGEDEPPPGWDMSISGDESGSFEGFSVLHGHAGDGKRIRLVPELKQGDVDTNLTLVVPSLQGRAAGEYRVRRADFSARDLELDCVHPAPGERETEMTLTIDAYDGEDFRGSFKGTLQCQPRSKEEKEEPPRVAISGTFVDN
jgi:hypothetical protein